jgi:hypothetical protein
MLYSGGASCTPVGIRHTISPVFKSYFTISDHGGAAAVIEPPGKLICMKLTGEENSTRSPFAAPAATSSFACAMSSAFCSGVTIALPPPRPPPPPPAPAPRAPPGPGPAPRGGAGIVMRSTVGSDLCTT